MNQADKELIAEIFKPVEKKNIWQWAESNIDYSRARSYDSDWKGPYKVDYLPYMKEVLEACGDMTTKEIWIWACTRGGKSENFILTTMRWMLATCPPYAMAYVGGQQTKVEQFFEKRILRGMSLADATEELMKRAKVKEHTVNFDGLCDLVVSWASNKQIAKGDSFPVIFADEVSSWPEYKADTLRERQATVPFPKLIGVSSADSESRRGSDEDPIIQEWENTDRREYRMKDPKGGGLFSFVMGGGKVPFGIKWDMGAKRADGTWDLEVVENTAHYITPGGAKLEESDRLDILSEKRGAIWEPTAKSVSWKRGYRVNRMMTPFPTGNFGNMARSFLEAKRKQDAGQYDESGRPPLRVFIYERLAEKYYTEKRVPELTSIDARRSEYELGQRLAVSTAYQPFYIGKRTAVIMTVDVQKDSEWWIAREWIDGGDSGLVDLGQTHGLYEIREIGIKHNPVGVLVDNSYEGRAREIIEAASTGILKGAVLSYGRDNLKDKAGQPREYEVYLQRDPYEGTANQGLYKCNSVTFVPDRIKNQLFVLTNGGDWHKWRLPKGLPDWYGAHMTAERSIDGKWERVRRDNHGWDCEVLQLLASKLYGLWRDSQPMNVPVDAAKEPAKPVVKQPEPPKPTSGKIPLCKFCGKDALKDSGPTSWKCSACGKNVNKKQSAMNNWGDNQEEDNE